MVVPLFTYVHENMENFLFPGFVMVLLCVIRILDSNETCELLCTPHIVR
ncbi:hypothetical protein EHF_0726 [Ehrlichia japonica]|uniref:Uncharacterized protein n=1 Tax=Ehrlichia japonica TaxID=391036 RepID=X5GLM2_9RICK|nr:hypothetical protein EHF_0726 [Ehrlichia japonica]